jgi:hypothetical protein
LHEKYSLISIVFNILYNWIGQFQMLISFIQIGIQYLDVPFKKCISGRSPSFWRSGWYVLPVLNR